MSKIMGKIFGTKEMRILMLGLDAAGKTSKFAPRLCVDSLTMAMWKLTQCVSNPLQIEAHQSGRHHYPYRRF